MIVASLGIYVFFLGIAFIPVYEYDILTYKSTYTDVQVKYPSEYPMPSFAHRKTSVHIASHHSTIMILHMTSGGTTKC